MALADTILTDDGSYNTPLARQVIYDHIGYIRDNAQAVDISGSVAIKYATNLYGLYSALDIPQRLWNVTALINKHSYRTPINTLSSILVPQDTVVSQLVKVANVAETSLY